MEVKGTGTNLDSKLSGTYQVVVNDQIGSNNLGQNPFAAGWYLDGLDRLFTVDGGNNNSKGVMYVYGAGGSRLFTGSPNSWPYNYTSPADDFGTLTQNSNQGGWTYLTKDQSQRNFDSSGRLTSVVDPHGLALTYTYDAQHRLRTVSATDGGLTTFVYNGNGNRFSQIQEPISGMGSRSLNFTVDGNNNLLGLTDADGSSRTWSYDDGHRVTNDQWAPFNVTFSYDSGTGGSNRLTSVAQGQGTTYTLAARQYRALPANNSNTANADVGVLTDPRSYPLTYTFDPHGRLLEQDSADGASPSWARNAAGLPVVATDPRQNSTFWQYNGSGDATLVNRPDGGFDQYQYDSKYHKPTQDSNAEGQTTQAAYDQGSGDMTTATDGQGATTSYSYYQTGPALGQLATVTDPLTHTTAFNYDPNNRRLTTVIDPLTHRTTTAYDQVCNPATVTDPLLHVSATGYDFRNRLTSQSDGAGDTTTFNYDTFGDRTLTIDPNGNRTTFNYDQHGCMTSRQQPEGRTTLYGRDLAGNATTVTDPDGHTTTFSFDPVGRELTRRVPVTPAITLLSSMTWDPAGNLSTTTDPLSHTATYSYDSLNRRTQVVDAQQETTTTWYDTLGKVLVQFDADRNPTRYAYDKDNRQTTVIDGTQAIATTVFDRAGNQIASIDADGYRTTWMYDQANRATNVIDALGYPTSQVYDLADRLTTTIDPLGHYTTFSYDNADRRTQVKDALGNIATTQYDRDGNVTTTIDADTNPTNYRYDGLDRRTRVTNALGQTTGTSYDPVGNVSTETDALGHILTYSYDFANRRTVTTQSVTDPLGGATSLRMATMQYDPASRATLVSDFRGKQSNFAFDNVGRQTTASDPDGKTTTTMYDPAGNVIQVEDALGKSMYKGYDGANRLVAEADEDGYERVALYDPAGNVTYSTDLRGKPTYTAYDGLNRSTRVTDPLSLASRTEYDPAGRVTASVDPAGFRATFVYDQADRETTTIDPLGQRSTLVYDQAGNVVQSIDPTNKTTTFNYDALNRQTSVTDPAQHTTSQGFDPVGRRTSVTDANTHTTRFGFDEADRRTSVTDGKGAITTTAYDNQDHVSVVIDANGWRTTYSYDDAGDKTQAIDPQTHAATYAYDSDHRLTSTTDQLGRRRDLRYDPDSRLTQETWYNASGTLLDTRAFAYDEDGNLTSASNSLGTITYSYDDDSRLSTSTDVFGQVLTYSYDQDGNRTLVRDSQGGTTTSVYDRLHRLTSRQFSAGAAQARFDLGWTPRGELAAVQRYQDVARTQVAGATSYQYDPVGGLVGTITHYSGGTIPLPFSGTALTSYAYSYDPGNRLSTIQDNGQAVLAYQYDNANEVTADGIGAYGYDGGGNRTDHSFSQGSNTGNQLQRDGTWTYTYDNAGNLLQKSQGANAETWVYSYDTANELVAAEDRPTPTGTATTIVNYKYDALGRKVEQDVTLGGSTTVLKYAYDTDGNVWADLNGSGTLQTRRLFTDGTDQVVARIDYPSGGPVVGWYLTDRLGSVRGVMTYGGTVTGTLVYDAFGRLQPGLTPSDRYGYTGRERDEFTRLQYNRGRWYDPATPRWLTRDPLEFQAGDGNLYRYVGNDAANATDPLGLSPFGAVLTGFTDKAVDTGQLLRDGWNLQLNLATRALNYVPNQLGADLPAWETSTHSQTAQGLAGTYAEQGAVGVGQVVVGGYLDQLAQTTILPYAAVRGLQKGAEDYQDLSAWWSEGNERFFHRYGEAGFDATLVLATEGLTRGLGRAFRAETAEARALRESREGLQAGKAKPQPAMARMADSAGLPEQGANNGPRATKAIRPLPASGSTA